MQAKIIKCDHCGNSTADIETIWTRKPELHLCNGCHEAWKKSLQDGKVGEAGAVFAFLGWLTSRNPVSGPFSARHDANEAARLAGKFCEMQGWKITDEEWHWHIKTYSAND